MKKLLFIGVAVMCLAMAAPAMAKVTVGGMIATDMYYWDKSAEANTPNGRVQNAAQTRDDFSEFTINMPQSNNRLLVRYANDEGNLTGYLQLRAGDLGHSSGGVAIDFKYAYIDYKLNDMVHFRIGRQDQAFATYTPGAAGFAWDDGFSLLANFGNFQVTDGDSVKAYIKFNDNVRMEVQFEGPRAPSYNGYTDSTTTATVSNVAGVVTAVAATTDVNRTNPAIPITQQNHIPRVDIALPISIANFSIEPAVTWQKVSYENKIQDDSYDVWGISLGVKAGFGPVTISAEGVYGQNLGDGNYSGGGNAGGDFAATARAKARVRSIDTNGDGFANFEDTDIWAGWIQFAFNFGPATLQMAFGMENVQNDGAPAVNDDIDVTRYGYALSVPIKVTKEFTIMPAIIYLDRGDSEKDGVNNVNNLTVDYGDQLAVGVQFLLTF
jgi:hypothetical protein